MTTSPKDLSILRKKIEQQRVTIASLKRGGHVHTDAQRQLTEMVEQLTRYEAASQKSA